MEPVLPGLISVIGNGIASLAGSDWPWEGGPGAGTRRDCGVFGLVSPFPSVRRRLKNDEKGHFSSNLTLWGGFGRTREKIACTQTLFAYTQRLPAYTPDMFAYPQRFPAYTQDLFAYTLPVPAFTQKGAAYGQELPAFAALCVGNQPPCELLLKQSDGDEEFLVLHPHCSASVALCGKRRRDSF